MEEDECFFCLLARDTLLTPPLSLWTRLRLCFLSKIETIKHVSDPKISGFEIAKRIPGMGLLLIRSKNETGPIGLLSSQGNAGKHPIRTRRLLLKP